MRLTLPSRVHAIAGGVAGGVVFIIVIFVAITLYRSSKRKVKTREIKDPFEGTGAQAVLPGAIRYASTSIIRKPPLNTQGRTEHPPPPSQPPRKFAAQREPLSIISLSGVGLLESREDPNIARSAQTERREVLAESHLNASTGQHNGESEQHSSSAPAYTWRLSTLLAPPTSPLPIPSVGMHAIGSDDGDQGVGEEYPFDGRRGLSVRVRMDGDSGRRRSGGNVIGTAYLTHTDAGAARVVELPPSYIDLRFLPARQD